MNRHQVYLLIFICALAILFSCSEKFDAKEYYFNPDAFKTSKVYTFRSVENPSKVHYWKITNTGDKELFTIRNNSKNQLIDELKEQITDNGSQMISYFKSHVTSDVWIQNFEFYPKKHDLMRWNLKETSVYEGEFNIKGDIFIMRREREFVEKTILNFKSKKYDALVFKDQFDSPSIINLEDPKKATNWNESANKIFLQYSYFAKGIGLIKYVREFDNGTSETMELIDIQ